MSMVERCAECGDLDPYGLCATFHRAREEQDMATAAENDDLIIPGEPPENLFALIRDGWRPPARLMEPYRPMLLAYYRALGHKYLGSGTLDDADTNVILGIIGVLDYLGVQHPATTPPDVTE